VTSGHPAGSLDPATEARVRDSLGRQTPDREVLTVDFTTNFLAPAAGDRFRATATVLRAGRTIVVTRGEVHALSEAAETPDVPAA
jgi:acyl-coenzyme A thioesterase PaaI-like protein